MRRHRLLLASVTLLAALGAQALGQAPQARRVRVLTYNIHHGEGVDGRIDLARLADVIRQAEPDVVALQEVDRNVERSGRVDQAAELARLTGLEQRFGRTIPLQGGEYGNVILSRWPILGVSNRPLPSPAGGEARAVLAATIGVPADPGRGGTFTVLATHLDHTRDPANRLASVEAIERMWPVEGDPGEQRAPMILAGDLNDVPDSAPIARLRESWSPSDQPGWAPTNPADAPRRKIDYVMVRPAGRWRIVEARVLEDPVASDHRPLLVVLELRLPAQSGGRPTRAGSDFSPTAER